jgi:hypothetical protein
VLSFKRRSYLVKSRRKKFVTRVLERICQVPLFVTFTLPSSSAVSNIAVFATVLSFPTTWCLPARHMARQLCQCHAPLLRSFACNSILHCMHGTGTIMYHSLTSDYRFNSSDFVFSLCIIFVKIFMWEFTALQPHTGKLKYSLYHSWRLTAE